MESSFEFRVTETVDVGVLVPELDGVTVVLSPDSLLADDVLLGRRTTCLSFLTELMRGIRDATVDVIEKGMPRVEVSQDEL